MGERNTEVLLREWGIWIREGGRVDLSARGALYHLIPEKRVALPIANISDAVALEVDRAIAQLRKTRLLMARVLWLEFACGYSTRKISTLIGCSREDASKLSGRAIGLVDCVLNPGIFNQTDLDDLSEFLNAA